MGGLSAEREVSLNSGNAILAALSERGYSTVAVDVDLDVSERLKQEKVDIAFIALHGRYGEDGTIQGLLEMIRIPYTGSGVLASALGMDKIYSRKVFAQNGLPVLPYAVVNCNDADNFSADSLTFGLPVVVKPSREGSSIGITIVKQAGDLKPALETAWEYDDDAIIEEYMKGREIQVGILNDETLDAIEIVPKREFYDYIAKYTDGQAEHLMPAPISKERSDEVKELALKAHKAIGCEGGTRVDFLFSEEKGFFLLEVNTLPGMTELSLLPEIAGYCGITFPELIERILTGARLKM